MNTSNRFHFHGRMFAAATVALLLGACAAAPVKPAGSADARAKLTQLQSNPDLATRAPVAMKDAELAVRTAEEPLKDTELAKYRVYMADRKVDIAIAQAKTSFAEEQRTALSQQRDKSRLDARTREADASTSQLATARVEADAARISAADSAKQAAELQRQVDELHAKPTDRGLVLTLGDVLFSSGQADLKPGATANLNRLVAFLNNYPTRTAMIEGHTDSIGGSDYNIGLSQRRADSVKSYLTAQGIGSDRLTTAGKGLSNPVAGNESAAGRQQNRRVEVIIANPPAQVSSR